MPVKVITHSEIRAGNVIDFTTMNGGARFGEDEPQNDIGLEICIFCGKLGKPFDDYLAFIHKVRVDWSEEPEVVESCHASKGTVKELKRIRKILDRRGWPQAQNFHGHAWAIAKARGLV